MGVAVLAFIIEKSYVHIIFTIFSQQILDELLQVFYLNPPSRLFSCPPIIASNKLSLKICCKNIVNITFIFIISYPCSHIHVPIQILITMAFAFNLIQKHVYIYIYINNELWRSEGQKVKEDRKCQLRIRRPSWFNWRDQVAIKCGWWLFSIYNKHIFFCEIHVYHR